MTESLDLGQVKLWRQVLTAAIKRGQLGIIVLRDFYTVLFAKLHDDIKEVHGIELELVAKAHVRLDIRKVFVRCNVGDDI